MTKSKLVAPGDKLAVIEEFEGGEGVYLWGPELRAKLLGEALYDYESRKVRVVPYRSFSLPRPGDMVEALVTEVAHKHANIKILKINSLALRNNLPALLLMSFDRDNTLRIKPTDLVKAKVLRVVGGLPLCSIEGEGLGVLSTRCSVCGERTLKIGPRSVKCVACGNKERVPLAISSAEK